MNNGITKYIFGFIGLVLLQTLILNNVHINALFSPFLYIAFILFLPFDFPRWSVMVLGFSLGMVIDVFSYTYGMHAFATVLLAFSRIQLLPLLSPRGDYEPGTIPNAFDYSWSWFLRYTIILTAIHHFALFFVEIFSFTHIYFTLLKALSSVVITVFLLILSQLSGKMR